MDRLIVSTAMPSCLFAFLVLAGNASFAGAAAMSLSLLVCLFCVRQSIFAPDKIYERLSGAVSSITVFPERLESWKESKPAEPVRNLNDLYASATEMLDSLDDFYTCLLSPEPARKESRNKSLLDYGLSFGAKRTAEGLLVFDANGNLLPEQNEHAESIVCSVNWASAAARAGILAGDIVLSVNDVSYKGITLARAYQGYGGNNPSVASFVIRRGDEMLSLALDLSRTHNPALSSRMLPGDVGYLRLLSFDTVKPALMLTEMRKLSSCKYFIVDLRNNRGGDIRHSLIALSLFNDCGVLGYCERRGESGTMNLIRFNLVEKSITLQVQDDRVFEDLPAGQALKRLPNIAGDKPVIVLMDKYTMSGAELFAGAMKDRQRARLVGEKTFGKGVGQDVIGIPPCVKVSITSMRFKTPSGQWPGDGAQSVAEGIEPDCKVLLPSGVVLGAEGDLQLQAALELLNQP